MTEAVDYQPGVHREHEARRKRISRDTPELSRENRLLVERMASTLLDLQEAGDTRRSTPISGQSRSSMVGSELDEGKPTRWARTLERKIQKQTAQLLAEYDARVEGTYQPPRVEKVRCIYDRCAAYGKRIPKFIGPNESIELVRCPKCDKKLTTA